MKTTFAINDDLTASLTDHGYTLSVRSKNHNTFDLYYLVNGKWELYHKSLTRRMPETQNIWKGRKFTKWAEELKKIARES